MRKILSVILIVVILVLCGSCSQAQPSNEENTLETEQQTKEQLQSEAEAFAEQYLTHLFQAEFQETDLLSAFPTEQFVTEFSKHYPQELAYDGNTIEIDGEAFESIESFIVAAEEIPDVLTLERIEKKETKQIRAEEFREKLNSSEFTEAMIDPLGAETLSTLISVDFDVTVNVGEETRQGRVYVYMINQNGEWKVISPTYIGWLLLGYDPFR